MTIPGQLAREGDRMIVAGIDIGGKNAHIVIVKDGVVLAKGKAATGSSKAETAERLYHEVLQKANLKPEEVGRVIATGSSAK